MLTNFKNKLLEKKRYFVPIFLFSGIIFDLYFIDRPDKLYVNIIIVTHIVLTALYMLLLNKKSSVQKILFMPTTFLMQFSMGALGGSLLVLYTRSGTLAGSSIFFLIFIALLVGNEFLHNQYSKIYIHLTIWYFLLITYCNIFVPILLKTYSIGTFVIAMLLSATIVFLFLRLLYALSNKELQRHFSIAVFGIFGVFGLYTTLYIARIIPPVPLSIENIGIYHYVEKNPEGEFFATYEESSWWQVFRETNYTFNSNGSDAAYCLSSTFAPNELKVQIAHNWQYRKDKNAEWVQSSIIKFPISGGRDAGYRAYTKKTNLQEGLWRCDVETTDGVLIGRVDFEVKRNSNTIILKEKLLD